MDAIRWALGASEDKVGPECSSVPVPPSAAVNDELDYATGYRRAIADVRKFLDERVLEWWTEKQ
jgi:hypothetical protein